MNKPKILCIAGKSGSGKTTLAEYFEKEYGIPMIQSYTDRAPRYDGENGHIFIDGSEFDLFKKEDMIAFTEFGTADNKYRYCCLHDDVKPINTYVIDEKGIDWLLAKHSDKYDIYTALIERPLYLRENVIDADRLKRDDVMFYKNRNEYDYTVDNSLDMAYFHDEISALNRWFGEQW